MQPVRPYRTLREGGGVVCWMLGVEVESPTLSRFSGWWLASLFVKVWTITGLNMFLPPEKLEPTIRKSQLLVTQGIRFW